MQTTPQLNPPIRFGVFEADLRSGELRRNGIKIKIQELPFRALKLLLAHPNEILSREQFRQALWPENVFVDFDHGISSAINRVRDALGDSADNPVYIETVERRGYRWIAPTHVPEPAAAIPVLAMPADLPAEVGVKQVVVRQEPTPEPVRVERPLLPILQHAGWMMVFPTLVLVLAAWSFRPLFHAAMASTVKPPSAPKLNAAQAADASQAEEFYLKGRFYWEKRTPEGLNKALDAFTQAIIHDASYAPAYVGLADCYNLLREYTAMPASEAYPRALAAAKRAVELDDRSSEAHASLAFVLFNGMWDSADAEREFLRAIQLNPQNVVAHHWYATYLSTLGRNSEALAEIEKAQRIDPASKAVLADKGDLLFLAGRREEAVQLLKQLEATEPDFISPHRYLKTVYLAEGDYVNYLDEWKKQAQLMKDASAEKLVDVAEQGYAAGGVRGMFESVRMVEKRLYNRGLASSYSLAQTDSLIGDTQEALRYLKTAYDQHDEGVLGMKTDPELRNLHSEPTYKDLVARVGVAN